MLRKASRDLARLAGSAGFTNLAHQQVNLSSTLLSARASTFKDVCKLLVLVKRLGTSNGKGHSGLQGWSSVDPNEVAKFAAMAKSWWDQQGPFAPLHDMNPVRCAFIRTALCRQFGRDVTDPVPLTGLSILDVGCGGGLLSEPLARMGAKVTGIDATEDNIGVARLHSSQDPLTASIEYKATTAEDLAARDQRFDAVVALEVVEHVANPGNFVESLGALCKPKGGVFLSTINRTLRSYALAIGAAEYVLQWVPRGTHDWSRFLTPDELSLMLRRANVQVQEVKGMIYNPLLRNWFLANDTAVNYILFAVKQERHDQIQERTFESEPL